MGAFGTLAAKELLLEARTKEGANTVLVLAFLVLAIGALALGPLPGREAVAASVFWTALAFASSLGLARSFTREVDRGTLDTLLLLPAERHVLYFAKAAANAALLLFVAVLVAPVTVALFRVPLTALAGPFLPVLLLGIAGIAATGTLLAAVAARTTSREVLLPVLLFPLVLPVLIAAVPATIRAFYGDADLGRPLTLLLGYDLAFVALATVLFEHVVEA